MSSGTSTEPGRRDANPAPGELPPWQFFLIGGMLAATAVVILSTGQTLANIIILSLTILAVTFVALGVLRTLGPLASPESATGPRLVAGRTRAALEREKTLVLRTIKELEFDFSMGKLSQVDFEQMGGRLRARAIGLIQQLDRGEYRAQIERELAGRLVESGFSRTAEIRLKADATAAEIRPKADATAAEVRLKADATAAEVRLKADATAAEVRPKADATAAEVRPKADATAAEVRLKADTTAAEVQVKADTTEVRPKADTTCPSCRTANDADARFCKQCGTRLS